AVAKEIITTESWSRDSVLLVIDRNFPMPEEAGPMMDISGVEMDSIRWSTWRKFFKIWNQNRKSIKHLDKMLRPVGEFQIIIPHLINFKYYTLTSNQFCKGFYLMEEGVLSYTDVVDLSHSVNQKWKTFFLRLIYQLLYHGRLPALPAIFKGACPYLGAFSITHFSFPSLSKKKIIPWPFYNDPALPNFKNVLVLGPYFEFGQLSMETELKGLEALFHYFVSNQIFDVHYKFHPVQLEQNQSPDLIRALIKRYKKDIDFHEIKPSISLENIAMSSKADFYLATSSTAIYAVEMGRQVYSYANILLKFEPQFQRVVESMPLTFRNKMIFIDF
ncbi:MAG: hypothetical protein KDC53_20935, partial [Saprospiraceae bacterium]|nr:hypothetical protein [Saprospiraceae bacterium]